MKLVLVRHGQTPANRMGALDTIHPGLPLTQRGIEQAEHLAQRWEDEVAAPPDVIAVSGLRRTRMTAAPLAHRYGLVPLICPGVRELRSGDVEMDIGYIAERRYVEPIASWCRGDISVRTDGGESGREALARAYPVLARVMELAREKSNENAVGVVVAHGALLRLLASSLTSNISAETVIRHSMNNTGTVVIEWPTDFTWDDPADMMGAFRAHTWNDRPVEEWGAGD